MKTILIIVFTLVASLNVNAQQSTNDNNGGDNITTLVTASGGVANLTHDLANQSHNMDNNQYITLFNVTNAIPNSLVSFTIHGKINTTKNNNPKGGPGYWYIGRIIVNGVLINPPTIDPGSINTLPYEFDYPFQNLRADNAGNILIRLGCEQSSIWPTQHVQTDYLQGSQATLSYHVQ